MFWPEGSVLCRPQAARAEVQAAGGGVGGLRAAGCWLLALCCPAVGASLLAARQIGAATLAKAKIPTTTLNFFQVAAAHLPVTASFPPQRHLTCASSPAARLFDHPRLPPAALPYLTYIPHARTMSISTQDVVDDARGTSLL